MSDPIISETEFKSYSFGIKSPDFDLDAFVVGAAQEIVEAYLHYPIASASYTETHTLKQNGLHGFPCTIVLQAPVIGKITTITLDGNPFTEYSVAWNYINLTKHTTGELSITYDGGLEPVPNMVKLAVLQIASLKMLETNQRIGTNGVSLPDGVSRSFVNYTNFDKYLSPLSRYRVI